MASTSRSSSSKKKTPDSDKFKAVLAEIQCHEKSALFSSSASGSHNPDLQLSLDVVTHKIDNRLYDRRPRDFVQDMHTVFTVDSDSALASAASSFKMYTPCQSLRVVDKVLIPSIYSLLQCLLEKHDVDLGGRQGSSSAKRHRRAGKRSKQAASDVFDFVFEEELGSGFLFEEDQFLGSSGDKDEDLFGKADDDSSAEDFVPLSFSFEQESVPDGRSSLYPELLDSYAGFDDDWAEWEDPVSDPASPQSTNVDEDDEGSSGGESSSPGSPSSSDSVSVTTTTTATRPGSEVNGSKAVTKRGKRQRTPSVRGLPMRWTKEDLLFKITNELPSEKLEGIILIVNPALEFGQTEDEDLEFDINTLDETTLFRLQEYVHSCLSGEDQGDESMIEGREVITITQTVTEESTPRKKAKTRTKGSPRKTAPLVTGHNDTTAATKKVTRSTQRRKNSSPVKTRSPATTTSKTKKGARPATTTQVIETTICHFVEQDEHFNYIPHGRGARLHSLVPEAFEVFRTEQVIKVQKSAADNDMEEEVDVI